MIRRVMSAAALLMLAGAPHACMTAAPPAERPYALGPAAIAAGLAPPARQGDAAAWLSVADLAAAARLQAAAWR
jgi:hypothetical protein